MSFGKQTITDNGRSVFATFLNNRILYEMTASTLLRAGLPESVLSQLEQDSIQNSSSNKVDPWQTVSREGFSPVFDALVLND
mmetsp:Transcript_3590/g.5309  ORF Transcript_3590/g.5309 Transcript_3590/m.5309 type:complete len:82 (-) Transcript_3590:231-476(-)